MTIEHPLGPRNRHVAAIVAALEEMSPDMRNRLAGLTPGVATRIDTAEGLDAAVVAELAGTKRALRDLEARHRALSDLSSDWYWEHDEYQRFTRISDQMLEKTGIRVAEMIGHTRWEFDLRCEAEERARLDAAMAAQQAFYDVRLDRIMADGIVRNISISGAPMFDAAGRYTGYRGIGKDITERRREQAAARESEVFARAALDSLPDLVCVLDADGKVIEVNAAWRHSAAARSSFASNAFVGTNYIEACERASGSGRADGATVANGLRDVLAGKLATFQHEYAMDALAPSQWFMLKVTRFKSQQGAHVVVAHEDITERKSAERILVLEQRVARCLAGGESTWVALAEVLRVVGESHGWILGFFCRTEGTSMTLDISASWSAPGAHPAASLVAGPNALLVGSESLVRAVLHSAQPVWIEDLAAAATARDGPTGARAAMRSAFAIAVAADATARGVLVFQSAQVRAHDHVIEATMRVVAAQVSQFLQRKSVEAALRESEARFHSLSDLSADWYWQQDAQLRFTSLCNGTEIEAGLAEDADCGKMRWELSGAGEADWDQHRRVSAAHLPYVDFEMRRAFPDRSVRDICISGTPIFDDAGHFTGYRGIGRDITLRKQEAAVLALEHRVSSCIAVSSESTPVVEEVIRAICESQRWSWGSYFSLDHLAGTLTVDSAWANPNELSAATIASMRAWTVAPGNGIAGRVWQSGQPIWVADPGSDPHAIAAGVAEAAGFTSGFAFACRAGGRTVGVLQFFGRDTRAPDPRLLSAMRMIGDQLGQYLRRRRTDEKLRFQAMLLDTVGDAVMASDLDETILYWNAAAERLYGWTIAEAKLHTMLDMVRPASDAHSSGAMREVAAGRIWRGEKVGHRRDGTTFPAQLTLAPVQDAGGVVIGVVGISRDISESKHAEQLIRDSARQQQRVAAFSQRALANTRLDTLLEDAIGAVVDGLAVPYCRILRPSVDGKHLVLHAGQGFADGRANRHGTDNDGATAEVHAFRTLESVVVDDYAKAPAFARYPIPGLDAVRSGASVIIGGGSAPFGVLAVNATQVAHFGPDSMHFLRSIANTLATAIDRIAAEEMVAHLAQFDALTGLPNRNLFRDRLASTLGHAHRNAWHVGVMFVDLDRFKDVNDTHGHVMGDYVLAMVAERLRGCVRSGDTIGRLGGDEFAIVLANLARDDDANLVAQQIVEALALPFVSDGHDVSITASVGISVFPVDGDDTETLLKNADAAMYLAKQQGRNGFHFYTEELNARVTRRIEIESEMRRAIANDEFVLHYQPELSATTGRIVGVEALIRWQHPVRGLLAPAEFIAAAEESGLIVPIGRWVAGNACAQAARWHRLGHAGLFVAINVSPLEIRRGNIVESIREALAQSGLDPRLLELELTETLVMDGAESFIRALHALKQTGTSIAIDDFGTGYSSLSYLKRFPIDKVKIDRMFIRDIANEGDDAAIVQAIVAMSHHLKLKVTAEGVETIEQAAFLRRCHCDILQGYLFGAPMTVAQMDVLLARDVAGAPTPTSAPHAA
jgi:diguanylate cyclase (GGDEF)-like protein/PAS domain S-box-containing protein